MTTSTKFCLKDTLKENERIYLRSFRKTSQNDYLPCWPRNVHFHVESLPIINLRNVNYFSEDLTNYFIQYVGQFRTLLICHDMNPNDNYIFYLEKIQCKSKENLTKDITKIIQTKSKQGVINYFNKTKEKTIINNKSRCDIN